MQKLQTDSSSCSVEEVFPNSETADIPESPLPGMCPVLCSLIPAKSLPTRANAQNSSPEICGGQGCLIV